MPRKGGSGGVKHSTRQKGRRRRGGGTGTYARLHKARNADRYDRPALAKHYA